MKQIRKPSDGFDSVIAYSKRINKDSSFFYSEFVVYDNNQVYPEYMIYFQKKGRRRAGNSVGVPNESGLENSSLISSLSQ